MSGHDRTSPLSSKRQIDFQNLYFCIFPLLLVLSPKNQGWQNLLDFPVFKYLNYKQGVSTQILYMKS